MNNSDSNSELFEQIRSFVATQTNEPAGSLLPETSLAGDLGLDGLDAELFIKAFAERFEVGLSDFVFERHFGADDINFLHLLYWSIFERERLNAKVIPITLVDLLQSAECKRWIAG